MKTTNIYRLMAVLAVSALMMSCDDDSKLNADGDNGQDGIQNVVPVFPDLVEDYEVEPGSTLELVFTPNLDWTVSIPSKIRQWFWINDESFKVTELSGKASENPVTVHIGVTENAEFDKNYSCEVTLEMGDSSAVIAKYMLPAKEKSLEVYAAKTDADGSFVMADDGVSYVYSDEVATSLRLIWSEDDADFRIPVRVISNCEWNAELPEFAQMNVPESTVGMVDLVITGESLDRVTGTLKFTSGKNELLELDLRVPSCRGIEVYSAKLDEGEFEYGEGGEYVWTTTTVSAVDVAWMGSDFRMPIKVKSKCNWTLDLPDWLTVKLPEKTSGEVSLTLMGVPSEYPLEAASGKIAFMKGTEKFHEITVNIPGCKDIMTFSIDMGLTALDFNNRGKIKTTTGFVEAQVAAHLTGVKGVRVVAVETTGNKVGKENPDWFEWSLSNWNTASGADVIQERTMSFNVKENYEDGVEGEDRYAVLFVLPPSITAKTADMFTENAQVKDDYVQWTTPISQKYYSFITIPEVPDPEYTHTFEVASAEKKNELSSLGETDHVYVLTYESPYSRDDAFMSMSEPYSSFSIFARNDNGEFIDKSEDSDFWLKFISISESNDSGSVGMYDDIELPYDEPSVGYVVFYKETTGDGETSKEVLAIVECVSPFQLTPDPVLELDTETIVFTPETLTKTFAVTSNVEWTVESSQDWCKVSPAAGENNGEVTVSVEVADAPREAVVTVRTETLSREIMISQKVDEVLEVDHTSLEFGFFASGKRLKLTSNLEWTATSSESWCTVTPGDGKGEKELEIRVMKNGAATSRTAVVTISSYSKTITVQVTQRGDDGTQTTDLEDEFGNILDIDNSFLTAPVAGATVYRCKSGPYYDQYKEFGCPILLLEYESLDTVAEIKVPSAIQWFQVMQYSYSDYVTVNDLTVSDTSGFMSESTDVVRIKMLEKVFTEKDKIESNKGIKVLLHKNMSTMDPTLVIFCRLAGK